MGRFFKVLVSTLLVLYGLIFIVVSIFGFGLFMPEPTIRLVLGGLGIFLIILGGIWLAVKRDR